MNSFYPITEVKARQILDSRGNCAVEVFRSKGVRLYCGKCRCPIRCELPDGLKQ